MIWQRQKVFIPRLISTDPWTGLLKTEGDQHDNE